MIPGSGKSPGEGPGCPLQYSLASLVAQLVKNPLAMEETWVQPLGWEDPLEEDMVTHSNILAWKIPMDKKRLAGCSSWGCKESDTTERLSKTKTVWYWLRSVVWILDEKEFIIVNNTSKRINFNNKGLQWQGKDSLAFELSFFKCPSYDLRPNYT